MLVVCRSAAAFRPAAIQPEIPAKEVAGRLLAPEEDRAVRHRPEGFRAVILAEVADESHHPVAGRILRHRPAARPAGLQVEDPSSPARSCMVVALRRNLKTTALQSPSPQGRG